MPIYTVADKCADSEPRHTETCWEYMHLRMTLAILFPCNLQSVETVHSEEVRCTGLLTDAIQQVPGDSCTSFKLCLF